MTSLTSSAPPAQGPARLPLSGLVALAAAVFIGILTEALPAGLLPEISAGLDVSESRAGLLVTTYAIGSLLAAIPLTALTRGLPRRRVLLGAILGFAAANSITAISSSYELTLLARLLAGAAAGLLWAVMAGYAMRMVPPAQAGRALAIAMAGTPVALSLGIPAATLLGQLTDWRVSFAAMSVGAVVVIAWALRAVPPFPGEPSGDRIAIRRAIAIPGIPAVLIATATFVTAHNVLYTYIAPLLDVHGGADRVGLVLLAFGVVSLAGIVLVGARIDRRLRGLTLISTGLFAAMAIIVGVGAASFPVVLAAAAGWGLAFGGAATLFQTAAARAAGPTADLAQALVVTGWNIAIAAGALVGGLTIDTAGAEGLPWVTLAFLAVTLVVVATARRHGFSARGEVSTTS